MFGFICKLFKLFAVRKHVNTNGNFKFSYKFKLFTLKTLLV